MPETTTKEDIFFANFYYVVVCTVLYNVFQRPLQLQNPSYPISYNPSITFRVRRLVFVKEIGLDSCQLKKYIKTIIIVVQARPFVS